MCACSYLQSEAARLENLRVCEAIVRLQHALDSPTVASLIEALTVVDASAALHSSLRADKQFAILRKQAHTNAASLAEKAIRAALAAGSGPSGGAVAARISALEAAVKAGESVSSAPVIVSLRAAIANARSVAASWKAASEAAFDLVARLQRALKIPSPTVASLVEVVAAADKAAVLHPTLSADHPQVAALCAQARARAAALAEPVAPTGTFQALFCVSSRSIAVRVNIASMLNE